MYGLSTVRPIWPKYGVLLKIEDGTLEFSTLLPQAEPQSLEGE